LFRTPNSHIRHEIAIFDISFVLKNVVIPLGSLRSISTSLNGEHFMLGDSEGAMTKPTIETVLNRINTLGEKLQSQLNSLHTDVGVLKSDVNTLKSDVNGVKTELSLFRNEFQLFRAEMTVRIDRIDGMANQTRAEMLNLRADYSESKERSKGILP
jgi:hypothetical protein